MTTLSTTLQTDDITPDILNDIKALLKDDYQVFLTANLTIFIDLSISDLTSLHDYCAGNNLRFRPCIKASNWHNT